MFYKGTWVLGTLNLGTKPYFLTLLHYYEAEKYRSSLVQPASKQLKIIHTLLNECHMTKDSQSEANQNEIKFELSLIYEYLSKL